MSFRTLLSANALTLIVLISHATPASDLGTVSTLISTGSLAEAQAIVSQTLADPAASAEDRARATLYSGMIAEKEKRPSTEVISDYQKAMELSNGETGGEAAFHLAGAFAAEKSYDQAKTLYERIYKGEIGCSDQVRGDATYEYGKFAASKLKDPEKAKQILLALDTGLIRSVGNTQQNSRYTLGHVCAMQGDFKAAHKAFLRADYSTRSTARKADLALQRAWTYMEQCRRVFDQHQNDPDFTFDHCRDLCQGVAQDYPIVDTPSLPGTMQNYFSTVAELMYLETYYYEKKYDQVPALVDAFLEKHGGDGAREREVAMAHYWKAAALHATGKYDECLRAAADIQDANYSETARKGFMDTTLYLPLFIADSYYHLGFTEDAKRELAALQSKNPTFVQRRKTMTDQYAVFALLAEEPAQAAK